jgi:RNA polymerase sigma-70 factor (family 1)
LVINTLFGYLRSPDLQMQDYSSYPDTELINLVKQDSYAAFTEIYNRHWSMLYGSSFNILRDKQACMDIVQDIFIWFWEYRRQLVIRSCKAYLLTAVKFKSANYIRNAKNRDIVIHQLSVTTSGTDENQEYEVRQLQEFIRSIAEVLPERCREIFQLSRYDYLSNKEIAVKLEISEKTVENQITIALKRLREKLSASYFLLL